MGKAGDLALTGALFPLLRKTSLRLVLEHI